METVGTKIVNRAATARPAAVPLVQRAARGPGGAAVRVQTAMRVSSPSDPAEREAESTAKRIMRMPAAEGTVALASAPAGAPLDEKEKRRPEVGRSILRALDEKKRKRLDVQRKAEGLPDVGANVAAEIQASDAAGQPLPLSVRRFMEPRFRADFGGVRIHTSDRAATLNRHLAARAFTVGKQVFFGRDQFRPETDEGKELIAHELTHTIQQGSVAQRSEETSVSQQAPVQVQRLGISDALDYFADKANNIPGFRMFTILLGVNPINMSRVERSAANILRAIVEFLPGGHLIVEALDNYGIFDKIGRWVDQQLTSLGISGGMIRKAIDDFLDSLSWKDIFHLGRVWDRAKAIFTDPISRIISFAKSLAGAILTFIKDAILRPLAALAAKTRGYDLLKAVLGRDPITGDPVPQTAETLIAGFMKLIGQEDVWQRMQQSKAIPRAWAWFKGALAGLLGFVSEIPGLFIAALKSLTISDVVLVVGAFAKVGRVFGNFIGRFISWAGSTVWNLLEIIFDVVSPGALRYIKRTGAALKAILKNPLPFVGNLVKAAKGGFLAFAGNFLTHLKEGLLDWLTGSLPGIYIPKAFTLQEIVKFVLSVLGLTWANIRQKLVKVIGEPAMVVLEKTFDIVVTLVRDGPAAAWDKIKEQLANLQDMVIGGITDMVVDMIAKKAIPKLVAMFIPGAGFISAILSIYDMIMVFVNKIAKIIQVVTGFIDSLVAIAAGQIGAAVKRVEGILAGLLSLAINFLAGFAGLGKVADKVMGVIQKIRAPIDKALDWLVNFIVTGAKKLFASLFGKKKEGEKPDERTDEQKKKDLQSAVDEGTAAAAEHADDLDAIRTQLATIRAKYRLAKLEIADDGGVNHHLVGEINPTYSGKIFTASDLAELIAKIPVGAKTDVRKAIASAKQKEKAIAKFRELAVSMGAISARKTLALADTATMSGWGTAREAVEALAEGRLVQDTPAVAKFVAKYRVRLAKYGYSPEAFIFDPKYEPGKYFKSHAEKQAFVNALNAISKDVDKALKDAILSIGVTREMCPEDCFPFFKAVSEMTGSTIVLADPSYVWVFRSGEVLRLAMPGKT